MASYTDYLAEAVAGIGAINWGTAEVVNTNLLVEAGLTGDALTVGYAGIALAGIVALIDLGQRLSSGR
jgi:uncharacterized membrane protein YuzA (DUF378 family)